MSGPEYRLDREQRPEAWALTDAQYRLIEASGHVAQATRAVLAWLHASGEGGNRCRCCGRAITAWTDHDDQLPCGALRAAVEQLGPAVKVTIERRG